MKRYWGCLLVLAFALSSCKTKTSLLSSVTGPLNEILFVVETEDWKGAVGDTIRTFFHQDFDGLPQAEPIFDLLSVPEYYFDKNLKMHRNIVQVKISKGIETPSVQFADSPWARTQKVFVINAPSREDFFTLFSENKEQIMNTFNKAERDRLADIYRRTPALDLFNKVKEKFGVTMALPSGFVIQKEADDFLWASLETRVNSKGVVVMTLPYKNESQFNPVIAMSDVNDILQLHIPASIPGSYMALDMEVPYSFYQYSFQGHYAIFIRGLWTAVNDFMAGPFVLNVVLDEQNARLIYSMGYIYYPNEEKRNMVTEVESILSTLTIPEPEEEKD